MKIKKLFFLFFFIFLSLISSVSAISFTRCSNDTTLYYEGGIDHFENVLNTDFWDNVDGTFGYQTSWKDDGDYSLTAAFNTANLLQNTFTTNLDTANNEYLLQTTFEAQGSNGHTFSIKTNAGTAIMEVSLCAGTGYYGTRCGSTYITSGIAVNIGDVYDFKIVANSSGTYGYLNNTVLRTCPASTIINKVELSMNDQSQSYIHHLDTFFIIENPTDLTCPAVIVIPPSDTVTLVKPEDNAVKNSLFNFTYNVSKDFVNCSLWTNISGTWKKNHTNYSINEIDNLHYFTLDSLPENNDYLWGVSCNDSVYSSNRTFTIDVGKPQVILNGENSYSSNNLTFLLPITQNLTLSFNATDDNELYAYEYNISNTNGTNYFYVNASISGTLYEFSQSLDISKFPLGQYTSTIYVSDSHTANVIHDYDIIKTQNKLEYNTAEGNNIKIISDDYDIESTDTKKNKDRYNFEFTYKVNKNKLVYYLESTNKINYIENSNYPAHFVIYNSKTKQGNWIDFSEYSKNLKSYKVIKINDNKYQIIINLITPKAVVKFNSIGGLNINSITNLFNIGSVIDFNITDSLDGGGIPYTILFNGTEQVKAAGEIATYNNISSGLYNVNLYGGQIVDSLETIAINDTYHLFNFEVDRSKTLYLEILNEMTQAIINETLTVSIKGESDLLYYTNDSYLDLGNLTDGEYLMQLFNENYTRRAYFIDINNNTQSNLTAYLLSNLEDTALIIDYIFRDENQERIENGRVSYYRQMGGIYNLIHQDDTDYAGQLRLSQDTLTEYKIFFEHPDYPTKTFFLRPIKTEYTIKVTPSITGEYDNVFQGITYNYYPRTNIVNASGWIDINLTVYADNNDLEYVGVRLVNHSYACDPVSCEKEVLVSDYGTANVRINLNSTGNVGVVYYFKRVGYDEVEVNYHSLGVISLLFGKKNLFKVVAALKDDIGNVYMAIIAGFIQLAVVGTAAELGIIGFPIILVVSIANIVLGALGFYNVWIALLMSIFGFGIYFILGGND